MGFRVVLFTVMPAIVPLHEQVLRDRGHRLLALFTAAGPRSRRADDYLAVAQLARPGLDVIASNQPGRWASLVQAYQPDLLLCAGFNWVLPADVLEVPQCGAVNCHAALLPKGRGINSIGWSLRDGDSQAGMTFHYMTPELDDGPILSQGAFPLTDDDDFDTFAPKWFELFPGPLNAALERVEAGDPGDPQDESQATYADRFEPEWLYIDWHKPARQIHLQVRSWWGYRGETRGAIAEINGALSRIVKTQLPKSDVYASAEPGTILEQSNGTLLVQCGDGPLWILQYSPEPAPA